MKKVLIHTLFYENYNYGGILQAYALYHKLEELGYECEELNYTRINQDKLKKIMHILRRIPQIAIDLKGYLRIRKKISDDRTKYLEKTTDSIKYMFDSFMNQEFKSTQLYNLDTFKNIKGYDYYVVGGDQVWNPEWTNENFFFANINDGKKIAYSCSAGKTNFTAEDVRKITRWINNIDVISVRERNFSELLTSNNVNNIEIADPVFLYDKNEWIDFSREVKGLPEHYLFVYILGDDTERRKKIREFADANKLKIVSIPHVLRYYIEADENFADVSVDKVGPREFVYLINNADYVMTDSFHGTAFSLILEKQFLNFSRFDDGDKKCLNARLSNVLEEYSLTERMIKLSQIPFIDIKNVEKIDYSTYSKVTYEKRRKALDFLETNLEGEYSSEC